MLLFEKKLKQNFIKKYCQTYQTNCLLKFLKRAYIVITLIFSASFESYSNYFFFINRKNIIGTHLVLNSWNSRYEK